VTPLNIGLWKRLFVPELKKNLLSIRTTTKLGALLNSEENQCRIIRSSKILATFQIQGRLYKLSTIPIESVNAVSREPNNESDLALWNFCFSHLVMDDIEKLQYDKGMLRQLKKPKL